MIPKMWRDLQQITDMWGGPGEGRYEQDTKIVEGCDTFNW